jgi:hypothetical protein
MAKKCMAQAMGRFLILKKHSGAPAAPCVGDADQRKSSKSGVAQW